MTSDERKIPGHSDPARGIHHWSPVALRQLLAEAPLYSILDTAELPLGFSPAAAAGALLRAGVRVIQYRHKEPFRRSHFEECVTLAQKVREAGGVFIVNDRADVAELSGADGVHLGQEDLPPEKARRFLGLGRLIGYSTHNLEQARLAASSPSDYIAVGPVFPTRSKKNPDPVVGLSLVSAVRALTNRPLIAIGGITMETAPDVLAAGADAVAVIRDLLAAQDLEARARGFLAVLRAGERP